MYPPYFDPCYYSYYCGYSPIIVILLQLKIKSTADILQWRSGYNNSRRFSLRRRNNLLNSTNSVALKQYFKVRSKSAALRISQHYNSNVFTRKYVSIYLPDKAKEELDDSDTEVEEQSVKRRK